MKPQKNVKAVTVSERVTKGGAITPTQPTTYISVPKPNTGKSTVSETAPSPKKK